MEKRKVSHYLVWALLLVFLITGVETLREEVRDRKLTKHEVLRGSSIIASAEADAFTPFYQESVKRNDLCFFSEKVATSIDHILYRGSKNFFREPVSHSIATTMSITAFPVCLFCDIVHCSMKSLYEAALIPFSNDEALKDRLHAHLNKTKRCTLALLSFPTGFISPDLVSQHFVTSSQAGRLIQPYGKLYSAKSLELYPKSNEDVMTILKLAKEQDRKVTFAGALMSQGKQALPTSKSDLLIHFDYLNKISIDANSKRAQVGAGALWGEVQAAANTHGLAVKVMQASNIFSIGGSLSINCHGWDHQAGTLKETVHSLLVVDSQGSLLKLYPKDELFDLAIGGLGGFGAILEAEISLATNTKMSFESVEMPTQDYVSYFKTSIADNPSIGMHYFRLCFDPELMFETGIAQNYIDENDAPMISSIKAEPDRGNIKERVELGVVRRLDWALPFAWKVEKSAALNAAKIERNQAMTFPLKCIFNESTIDAEWLQEYFVSAENLDDFLRFLGQVLKKNKVPVYNASVRYVKQNASKGFSYSRNEDMFAIVLFFNQSLLPTEIQKTRVWVQSVLDYLHTHKGTYYLPYQNFATLEQFRACYPEWQTIAKKKEEYDPEMRFTNGFFQEYLLGEDEILSQTCQKAPPFRAAFSDPAQRDRIKGFLENVFMQLDTENFFALVDDILTSPHVHDKDMYSILQKRLKESSFSFLKKNTRALKSLKAVKKDLSDQMQELIGNRPVNGYVEIGYPGRLCKPIKKKLNFSGPTYVVNEQEQLADYVESGFPRPYDRFVYINDYDSIRHQDIPTGSVDLVAMYIGLHHIPPQKLTPFIQSIHRILSPGGSFILMDHDATTPELQDVLSVVHSIFNVATSVSAFEEVREFRDFQSLAHWETLLNKHGFARDSHHPLIREGDSTLNSLIRFTKAPTTEEEFQAQLHADPLYLRESIRTYLTAPEWHNVRLTQGYGKFINTKPFYEFPWFEEVKNMWSVFGQSWKAARRNASFKEVLFSDCTLMNLFITSFTSIEYSFKGIISLPLSWIYTSESIEDARTLHMLVKTDIEDLSKVDPRIRIESKLANSNLKHLILPRYIEMHEILLKLAHEDITFIDIAGQKAIQIDLCVKREASLKLPLGCQKLYETPAIADPSKVYIALDVEVQHLNCALRTFLEDNIPVVYIHDF